MLVSSRGTHYLDGAAAGDAGRSSMTSIFIASLHYAPEETGIAPYSTGVAEHLAAQGYSVTVLAGLPHYPERCVADEYRGDGRRAQRTEVRNGVVVRRSRHHVPRTQSALRRGLYEATSLSMAAEGWRLPKPDAVIGVVPSLSGGITARALAARFGVPYGLLFQDLASQACAESGIAGGRRVAGVVRAAERWAAGRAAAVGIIAEGFRPYVESLGVDATRIRRVRNWTHTSPAATGRETMRARLGWDEAQTVCLHAGNMGALQNVIDAAVLASAANQPVLFVLMGDGNQRQALEAVAARYRLRNLRFLPLQAAVDYGSVLAAADILLVNQRASVDDLSLPSKLTSYFAAGRPVVAAAAAHSETAREVSWSSGGIVVAPEDPKALLAGILRVANDGALAAYLGRSGAAWAASVLSPQQALRSYEQLVAAVLASGTHGRVHSVGRVVGAAAEAGSGEDPDFEQDRRAA